MAIDNTTTFVQTASGTSHSASLTLNAGTGRKIVVIAFIESAAINLSGATFDGNAMTQRVSITNPGDSSEKLYAYEYDVADGVGAGSKTVTVTSSSASIDVSWHAWQLSGRATGAPEYAASTTTDNTVTATTDSAVSCTAGADVCAVVSSGSATPTFTWSGGTVTERTENNETNYTTCSADAAGVSAGTKTVTATASVSSGFKNLIVVSIAAAASGSVTITSVNTTNTAFSAQTDSAVVGTGLSASVICTYAGIACTNESASSSTSLKITFPNFFTNNIKLGRNYEFKVVG